MRIARHLVSSLSILFFSATAAWSQPRLDTTDNAFAAAVTTLRNGYVDQAIESFDKLAKGKHLLSSVVLGKIYLEGGYVARDLNKAGVYLTPEVIELPVGLLYEQQLRATFEEAGIKSKNIPPDRFDKLMELGERRNKPALLKLAIMGMNTDENSKYQKIRKLMQALPPELDFRLAPSIEFFDPLRDWKRPHSLHEREVISRRRRIEFLAENGVPLALLLRTQIAIVDSRKSNTDLGREKWAYLALLILAGDVAVMHELPEEKQSEILDFALAWAQSISRDFEPAKPITWCLTNAEGSEQQCMLNAVQADSVCNFEGFGESFAAWETSRAYFGCRMRR